MSPDAIAKTILDEIDESDLPYDYSFLVNNTSYYAFYLRHRQRTVILRFFGTNQAPGVELVDLLWGKVKRATAEQAVVASLPC